MCCDSWGRIDCQFPKGTETKTSAFDPLETSDGVMDIFKDYYDVRAEHLLDNLIAFFGKPLNEVPGLELNVYYEATGYSFLRMELTIINGKCTYKESTIAMEERPMNECSFNFGQRTCIDE